MPKPSQGRFDGIWGMKTFTSEELYHLADQMESQLSDPLNTDDPKWLKRRIDRVRALAIQKQAAKEQKDRER